MFYRILDETTQLRLGHPSFAAELYSLTDDNRNFLRQWLPWVDGVKSPEDTEAYLQGELSRFADGIGLSAAIFYGGAIAGVVGYNQIDRANQSGQIGYWLGEAFTGKGLMTAAVKDLVEVGRSDLSLKRIEIRCAVQNAKSRAIPERLGFANEGTLRKSEKVYENWYDHVVYSLVF